MRIAIVQSNYIPWKGYFDLMRSVDEFVLFDDAQYTRRDWRNRNRIMTAQGPRWLTIPVQNRGQYLGLIKDITVSDPNWAERHWRTIAGNYARAPYFRRYAERLERLYRDNRETRLSAINRKWLETICEMLDIRTRLTWSTDYQAVPGRTERLAAICREAGADTYVSGPAARVYIDPECFRAAGIELRYFDYDGYPEYEQLHQPFDHHVSVIDLIFNKGPQAMEFMRRS
jgi:hypothetical protein